MPRRAIRPKYAPLTATLASTEGASRTLTFAQLEALVGAPLPAGAYRHLTWWGNTYHEYQSRFWLHAGWRVGRVNLSEQIVTFVRQPPHA